MIPQTPYGDVVDRVSARPSPQRAAPSATWNVSIQRRRGDGPRGGDRQIRLRCCFHRQAAALLRNIVPTLSYDGVDNTKVNISYGFGTTRARAKSRCCPAAGSRRLSPAVTTLQSEISPDLRRGAAATDIPGL